MKDKLCNKCLDFHNKYECLCDYEFDAENMSSFIFMGFTSKELIKMINFYKRNK